MTRGVSKSGSPTPRLMTSSIVAAMSKKRRIPDGGTARTRSDRTRSASGGRGSVSVPVSVAMIGKPTASTAGEGRPAD